MKKNSQPNLATLYSEEATHAIDKSNRIMLPANWRVDGAPRQFFVLLVQSASHLIVCPPEVYEKFLEELRADTADKTLVPKIERALIKRVRFVNLDLVGRLPLPSEFMVQAGIDKQGVLIGRGSKFEVWSTEKYKSSQDEWNEAAKPAFQKMENL